MNHSSALVGNSPGDSVSMKIIVPIAIVGWCQEGHSVIKFSKIWIYETKESIDKPNCINRIWTFQSEDATHGRTSVICGPSQAVILQLYQLESKFVDLQACSVNVGTLRGRSRDTAN